MSRSIILTAFVVVVLCPTAGASRPRTQALADPIAEWSLAASAAATASGMAPLRTPISLAMLHLAMHDAIERVSERSGSRYAAAVEAGYRVLLVEFPSQLLSLQLVYERLSGAEPDSSRKRTGMTAGARAAGQLLESRANDGRNRGVTYVPGSGPGVWVPTPPGFLAVSTAFLAEVTPFTMTSPSQFRPDGPPPLPSKNWLADYNEVKALGAKYGSTRTPAQTATALFWEPLAGTVWVPTIRRLAREQRLDLETSARFQAVTFAAFADGLIACWDAKLHFNFWRPVTAIQNGDADGHPQTDVDPGWEPLAVTPNFPEYPSGHACATAAVTHTIEDFLGRGVAIPARNVVTGEERVYRRATDVVKEVTEARMLLGVHFRSADEDGAEIGRRIARQVRRAWKLPGTLGRSARGSILLPLPALHHD